MCFNEITEENKIKYYTLVYCKLDIFLAKE